LIIPFKQVKAAMGLLAQCDETSGIISGVIGEIRKISSKKKEKVVFAY